MSYVEEGIKQRAEILQGSTDTLAFYPKIKGDSVIPSSATVAIHSPDTAVLVAETPVVVGTGGILALSQVWPEATYYLAEDYYALFTYVVDGVTYTQRVYFDVVLTKLLCPISHNNILGIYKDIENHLAAIGETDSSSFIEQAWSEILDRIRGAGNRPSLILDVERLVNPATHLACHYICNDLSRDVGDIWDKRAEMHEKRYNSLFGQLGDLKYDLNEDGQADKGETSRIARVRFHV